MGMLDKISTWLDGLNNKSNTAKIKAQDHLIQTYINQLTQDEIDSNPLLTKYLQGAITQEERTLLMTQIEERVNKFYDKLYE